MRTKAVNPQTVLKHLQAQLTGLRGFGFYARAHERRCATRQANPVLAAKHGTAMQVLILHKNFRVCHSGVVADCRASMPPGSLPDSLHRIEVTPLHIPTAKPTPFFIVVAKYFRLGLLGGPLTQTLVAAPIFRSVTCKYTCSSEQADGLLPYYEMNTGTPTRSVPQPGPLGLRQL